MKKFYCFLLMHGMAVAAIAGSSANNTDYAKIEVASAPTVVAKETLRNGMELQVVKTADGTLHKRVIGGFGQEAPKIEVKSRPVVAAAEEAQSTPFYENFESWDGTTYDWIPEGWTDVSKVNPPNTPPADRGINPTWQVESPSWDVSIDGNYFARIANHYYTDKETNTIVNKPQDEWLITPAMTLTEQNWLYFYLCYHPGWVFFDSKNYTFTSLNNVMEVHVSADDGATWDKLWSCLEDAQKYSTNELWSSLASITGTWIPVRLSLEKYSGKTVKIAFRYVGNCGESMVIDAVAVRQPKPQAYYTMPFGSFYSGFDVNQSLPEKNNLLCAPFSRLTFYNCSNIECETFKWTYINDDGESATTEDMDLEVHYEPGIYDVPSLHATTGVGSTSEFKLDCDFIKAGGSNTVETADGKIEYGACNYNSKKGISYYTAGGSFLFGSGSDNFWTSYIGMSGVKVKLTALCNYFPAPTHSYCFNKVWVSAIAFTEPDAVFTLEIKKVLSNGSIDSEPLAIAHCNGSQIVTVKRDGVTYATLPFDLKEYLTVDTGLLMTLKGFDDASTISEFAVLNQYVPNADGSNYAYVVLTGYKDNMTDDLMIPASHIKSSAGALCTSLCFNINANFTWLECNDPYFYAAEGKQSKGLKFYTQFKAEDFKVTGDGVGDWISYKFGAYDEETSRQLLTLTVAENTGHNRQSDVTVSVPGSTCTIQVMQDGPLGGVEAVTCTKSAHFAGDVLEIRGAAGTSVAVYNAMGVKVAEETVESDNASIDASALSPAGLYVLKFSDGTTVKAIK